MKVENFLEKFELFAEAPNAVPKMRELALRLAFSGRISGENPGIDGVPAGWDKCSIESICTSITPGFACSRSHQIEGGHVHLRTHNISTLGTLNFDLLVRIDPKMVDPQKASLRKGDILFNNTNSQELVGKTSLVVDDYPYSFSNHITRIRLKEDIFPGYVAFYLTFLRNSGHFARICTRWINQAAVNTDMLKTQLIPLPTFNRQKLIVDRLNDLMSLCSRLELQYSDKNTRQVALSKSSLTRFADAPTQSNLDCLFHSSYSVSPAELRAAILALAVRGKLVPQDPSEESASASLARLGLTSTKSAPDHPTAIEYSTPESWTHVRFGDVAAVSGGVTLGRKLGNTKTIKLPYLRVANVKRGDLDLRVIKEVTIEEEEIHRYRLQNNDLLMTEGGDWDKVGRAAIWRDEIPICLHQNHIFRARLRSPEICPLWFVRYFNSLDGRRYFESASKQTTNLASINMRQVKNCPVPFPPLAEQRRIVAKVDQLMSLLDLLEEQIDASRAAAAHLLEAVVAELTVASGAPSQWSSR